MEIFLIVIATVLAVYTAPIWLPAIIILSLGALGIIFMCTWVFVLQMFLG